MKILGLSTSSDILSIAVCESDQVLSKFHERIGKTHSNYLIKYIKESIDLAKVTISDIDLFSVDIGPGSFTGLRVGVTAMKVAAKFLKKPIVGICSLDIIAYGLNKEDRLRCVILDAKQNKIYTSLYRQNGRISDYFLANVEELLIHIDEDVFFIGDAIEVYKSDILKSLSNSRPDIKINFAPAKMWYPNAVNVVRLGMSKYKSMGPDDYDRLVPMYIYSKECSIKGI